MPDDPKESPVGVLSVRSQRAHFTALLERARSGASTLLLHPRLTDAETQQAQRHLPRGDDAWRPDGAHVIVPTSGSTGVPKLIVHALHRMRRAARYQAERLGFGRDDVWATPLPLSSIGGLMVPLRAEVTGGSYHLWRRWDPERVMEDIQNLGITHLSLTPHQAHDLLQRSPPPSVACVLLGGAPSAHLVPVARAQGWPVAPGYGATEGPATLAVLPPGEDASGGSYGPPLSHVRLRGGSAGAPASIAFRSPTGALGRLEHGRVASLDRNGWVPTGDVGWIDDAGHLHVEGRADNAILVGGMTVDPVEVEAALLEHPRVRAAAVVDLPHPRLGSVLGAAAEVEGVDKAELRRHLEGRLVPPKWPKRLAVVDALPRLATGKVDPDGVRGLLKRGM